MPCFGPLATQIHGNVFSILGPNLVFLASLQGHNDVHFLFYSTSSSFTPTHSLSLSCHVGNASLPSSPFPLQIKMTPCSKIEVNLLSTPFKKIPLLLMLILDRFDVDDGLGDSKGMGTPSCPSPSSPHATRSLLPLRFHVNLISTSHFLLFHFFLFKPSSSPASWSL